MLPGSAHTLYGGGIKIAIPRGGFEGLWRVTKSSSGEWLSAGRNKEPIRTTKERELEAF